MPSALITCILIHPFTSCRAKSFSAKETFGALIKMMPLEVMMPTTGQLTLTLPTTGVPEKSFHPFGDLITIINIKDEVVLMPSLQKPKKVPSSAHNSLPGAFPGHSPYVAWL